METLGERIRSLRKAKGLTLQALAGSAMTKGMLSLIENNKANPSMESLSYIAGQLGVDRNELLAQVPTAELRALLQEVEKMNKKHLYEPKNLQPIIEKIAPYAEKLPFRYESARLLEIYSRCLYYAKIPAWQQTLEQAEEMYEGLHLMNNSADVHMFRAMTKFQQHDYQQALRMLQDSRKAFEKRDAVLDSLKKLDFDYLEAILYMAIGERENALRLMAEALDYSKQHQIYYRTADFYRALSFQAILSGDIEGMQFNIHKLRLFSEFSEDKNNEEAADLIEAHYYNSFVHDYEKAIAIIGKHQFEEQDEEWAQFYLEKGKALFGMGHLDEALEWLKRHTVSEFLHHPYDLSMNYEKDAYMALIYEQQGKHNLALKHAIIAKDLIEPMPDLPYKAFILDVYKKIVQ